MDGIGRAEMVLLVALVGVLVAFALTRRLRGRRSA
jgi:hypothetical protein